SAWGRAGTDAGRIPSRSGTRRVKRAPGSPRRVELLLLPGLEARVVMEPREDPSEQTQARSSAPTIPVAVAGEEPSGLFGSACHGENEVPEHEREDDLLHGLNARLPWSGPSTVSGGGAEGGLLL